MRPMPGTKPNYEDMEEEIAGLEEQRDFLLRLLGKARAKLPLDSAIRKEIGNYLEHKKAKS